MTGLPQESVSESNVLESSSMQRSTQTQAFIITPGLFQTGENEDLQMSFFLKT